MKQFGMQVKSDGTPPTEDRVHIDKTWQRFEAYRSGSGTSGYVLPAQNPFAGWKISNRYANELNFSLAYVAPHKEGAQIVKSLVRKAILEGRLIP